MSPTLPKKNTGARREKSPTTTVKKEKIQSLNLPSNSNHKESSSSRKGTSVDAIGKATIKSEIDATVNLAVTIFTKAITNQTLCLCKDD